MDGLAKIHIILVDFSTCLLSKLSTRNLLIFFLIRIDSAVSDVVINCVFHLF